MAEPLKVEKGHRWYSMAKEDWLTALAPCTDKSATGHWYCVSHDEGFANNMMMHTHTGSQAKSCTIAWICHEHGPEVP